MSQCRRKNILPYLLLGLVCIIVVLIVAFPRKRPFRDLLPPLTFFGQFFDRHGPVLTRSLSDGLETDLSLYRSFCKDLIRGGVHLEKLLDAAWNDKAYSVPMIQAFVRETNGSKSELWDRIGFERCENVELFLAAPGAVCYGGDAAQEIQIHSTDAWQAFSPSFKALLSDLLKHSFPAALRFQEVKTRLERIRVSGPGDEHARSDMGGSLDANPWPESVASKLRQAARADLSAAWQALIYYCDGLDRALKAVEKTKLPHDIPAVPGSGWFPEGILYAAQTPFGLVLVGGEGDNLYPAGDLFLVIDLGGNDFYFFDERFNPEEPDEFTGGCCTVIDLKGDDFYEGSRNGPAAGILAYDTIVDLDGDDLYAAGDIGLGAGLMGLGLLIDVKGDDRYTAGAFSLGAASHGAGLLIDGEGGDVFKATGFCQGFAGPSGLGCLLDESGYDLYLCLPRETDRCAAQETVLLETTFSQGAFAAFEGKQESGGIGLLLDLEGDDSYRGGLHSQGAAAGRGIGLLLDGRGYDFFNGRNQSQGYGCNGGIGILRDLMGNDHYLAGDLVQGVGEDGSLGFLIDDMGDDRYSALGTAQGMNRAGGTGMLSDGQGKNAFQAPRNALPLK